jgi:hypothetical protein
MNKPLKEYSNYAELRFSDGLYQGQVQAKNSNVREGHGKMLYTDNSSYIGQWKKGKR